MEQGWDHKEGGSSPLLCESFGDDILVLGFAVGESVIKVTVINSRNQYGFVKMRVSETIQDLKHKLSHSMKSTHVDTMLLFLKTDEGSHCVACRETQFDPQWTQEMEPAVMNGSVHTARKQHQRICT